MLILKLKMKKTNSRKIKVFLKLHWVGISFALIVILIGISFVFFLRSAITAWVTSESYFKKASLAQYGLFFYIFLISLACP